MESGRGCVRRGVRPVQGTYVFTSSRVLHFMVFTPSCRTVVGFRPFRGSVMVLLLLGLRCFRPFGVSPVKCLLIGVSCSSHLLGFAFCGSAFMSLLYGYVFSIGLYRGMFLFTSLGLGGWSCFPFIFLLTNSCGILCGNRWGGVLKKAPSGFLLTGPCMGLGCWGSLELEHVL